MMFREEFLELEICEEDYIEKVRWIIIWFLYEIFWDYLNWFDLIIGFLKWELLRKLVSFNVRINI